MRPFETSSCKHLRVPQQLDEIAHDRAGTIPLSDVARNADTPAARARMLETGAWDPTGCRR